MARRLQLQWVVFAGGAVLMALEILSSRILAPHFGSSVYVWGSVISVFLAALALGYWWGGRRADRDPSLGGLGQVVVAAAAAQAVLLVGGARITDAVGRWSGGGPGGTLLAAAVLFAVPSVLLATISPYAVRLAARDLDRIGHTAGRLYALSTAGSLAGTLGCTFVLIPRFAIGSALALVLAACAATALVALAGDVRRHRGATALAALLLLLAVIARPLPAGSGEGLVEERVTPYQTLRVVDRGGVRWLESDGVVHGAVTLSGDGGAAGELAMSYPRVLPAAWLLAPAIERVLILGMGGGNVAAYLRASWPRLAVDFVDVDPAVPEMARRHMGFRDGEGVAVHVADARRFLEETAERWDLVVVDTYIGLSVPFHLTTREFLDLARSRLSGGGVLAVNLATGLDQPFPRAIYRTLAGAFPTVHTFQAPRSGNLLLFATEEASPGAAVLARRAESLDRHTRFDPSLTELLELRAEPPRDLSGVPVLTDAYAPVERLIHLADDPPRPGRRGSTP
ncbi:MAG TPA: fused MFS/spermidine synthase [Thermoanaerobaculia bacterium]|nr:fused MFS/spermidine synthase [Thermoanaerobaculia bacterium]